MSNALQRSGEVALELVGDALEQRVAGDVRRIELRRMVALAFEPGAGQAARRARQQQRAERRRDHGLRAAGGAQDVGGSGHVVGAPREFQRRSTAYERHGCQACARASTSRHEAVPKSCRIAFSTATSFGGKASGQPSARIAM